MPGWEFLDEAGRPVTVAAPADPDPLDRDPPTLPWWLDPRKSSGRTVLYCLFVVLGAWILSARQGTPVDTGPGTDAGAPAAVAEPATASTPAGPTVLRLAALGRLSGPGRTAALLLEPPDTNWRGPGTAERIRPRQERAAAVLRDHLRRYRVAPAPAVGSRHCALVLRADRGSTAVVVSVVRGARRAGHPITRWQALGGPGFTFEWVQRVDGAGRTVLVAAYGAAAVPGLDPLIRLATDPRLTR